LLRGRVYALTGGVGYGTLGIFSTLFYDHRGSSFMLLVLRFCGGWTVFAVIVLARGGRWPARRDAVLAILLGPAQLAATICLFVGFQHASPGLVVLLFYINPLLVTIGAGPIFGERLGRQSAKFLGLGMLGIALTVGLPHSASALGVACGLGAGVFTSVFILGSRHVMSRTVDTFQFMALAYTGPAAAMLGALLIHGTDSTSAPALEYALLVIALGTVLPALLLYSAIRLIGAGHAARLATVEPLTAVVLSFLVLGDTLTPTQIAGGVLVLVSVVLLAASPEALENPVVRPLAEP